jgi:succinate dehydrogenase / fumarate reductase flavoprotein subunit
MQDLVGIVRVQNEMERAITEVRALAERAKKIGVAGNREYNPGWHTSLDLRHLLTISEAIARSAAARKESRGGHFRDDYPEKSDEFSKFNHVIRQGPDREMILERVNIPPLPDHLKAVIEEMK